MKLNAIFQSERKVDRLEGFSSYWHYLLFDKDKSVYFSTGAEKPNEILGLSRSGENFKIGKFCFEEAKLKFSVCDRVSLTFNGVNMEDVNSYRFQGELKGDCLKLQLIDPDDWGGYSGIYTLVYSGL